jgi:hypothetical protein
LVLVAAVFACLPDLPPPPPPKCGSGLVDLEHGETCDPGDAGTIGCTPFCQVTCEGGVVDDATSHCYFWTQAVPSLDYATQHTCADLNAHPVSFVDPDELAFVVGSTKNLPDWAGASWVGLERGPTNDAGLNTYFAAFSEPHVPGWAATCPGCFGYTDASDFALPANMNSYPCVNWRHTLATGWVQTPCTLAVTDAGQLTNNVLCEREPPGSFSATCADASTRTCIAVPVTRATKRYDVSPAAIYDVARNDCMMRGGQLVHFASGAEREEVSAEVERSVIAAGDFWIGLYFDTGAKTWKWVDDAAAPPMFPTPWADLEPTDAGIGAAIHIEPGSYTTHLAHAADSTVTHPYVCEFAK